MLINVPKDLGRPEPIMAGIYKAAVTNVKVDKSKSSENMLIKPELTIQSQSDADGKKVMGRKVFDNWTVAETSIGIWASHYKALTGEDLPSGQFEIDEFINMITSKISNKECIIQIEVETKDDVSRNRIKRYSAISA